MCGILDELKTNLKTIAEEDSRDADLMTDGTRNFLRGRAELAHQLISWIKNKEKK